MWQVQPSVNLPDWMLKEIHHVAPQLSGRFAANLLWNRGLQAPEQVAAFIDLESYEPTSPDEFGLEMKWAVERLQQARLRREPVVIWGDFDADGVTATAVLWEGLADFLNGGEPEFSEAEPSDNITPANLSYYIPNRFSESHGLNCEGIQRLSDQGCQLIVTCDTGSTNLAEIELASHLGIDVIITDHHTLPETRPPVVAILNPRSLTIEHPLRHLSGVAVAYKLVEALYQHSPELSQTPLKNLLDLVAIGLIADLVELKGDCRYLAHQGIQRLQTQLKSPTRPGVAKLLELCKRTGDRPTDISFGLGPRINAVSRIHGDARFCVELLTSRDKARCMKLALDTELANSRRKALQKDVLKDVERKLTQIDLSTTAVILLTDPQWSVGVLGLVASEIAQKYGRPTILLSVDLFDTEGNGAESEGIRLARGSARSIRGIDLYELVKGQAHLLHRFGGHPFAAGLSLPVEDIPLFTDAVNRQLRQQINISETLPESTLTADLVCTVSDLGRDLFQELKLLEPYGMGNPVPQLLIQNCWFTDLWHANPKDLRGGQVRYIKTTFNLWDDSAETGFPGIWWGHYKDEVPTDRCNVLVELDFDAHRKQYMVRLIAVAAVQITEPFELNKQTGSTTSQLSNGLTTNRVLDWRHQRPQTDVIRPEQEPLVLERCPTSWEMLRVWFRKALRQQQYQQKYQQQSVAIAYSLPAQPAPMEVLENLIGIAKYLSRTGQTVTRQQLQDKLKIGDAALRIGFECLQALGFQVEYFEQSFRVDSTPTSRGLDRETLEIEQFLSAIQEEQFQQKYFWEVPIETIQAVANQAVEF